MHNVNLPLKYLNRHSITDGGKSVPRLETAKVEVANTNVSEANRSRVVLDSSTTKIGDRPSLLEERLLKTNGVLKVEINAFSGRIAVEFDPRLVSLDAIKNLISSKP